MPDRALCALQLQLEAEKIAAVPRDRKVLNNLSWNFQKALPFVLYSDGTKNLTDQNTKGVT